MAIAIVDHAEGAASIIGRNTTGANLLVAFEQMSGGTGATVFDNKSNVWTALTLRGAGSDKCILSYVVGSPVVGTSHDFSGSGTSEWLNVAAFSGASSFDQESGSGGGTAPGSITPAGDNELFVCGKCDYSGTAPTLSATGWTVADASGAGFAARYSGGLAYKIQTTGAAENPSWTVTTGNTYPCAMATFTATGGGGGGSMMAIFPLIIDGLGGGRQHGNRLQ